jgi:hypothetical protein
MTTPKKSARTRSPVRRRARAVAPAAALPVPHPSWFGHAVDPADRLAPDQFWARLGL